MIIALDKEQKMFLYSVLMREAQELASQLQVKKCEKIAQKLNLAKSILKQLYPTKGVPKMNNQERLMLATLKGVIDGQVVIAKAIVRAAFVKLPCEDHDYGRGFRVANRRNTVAHLRTVRGIQRHIHEYCKGAGYYVR